jgi:hypothetical protein
MNRYQSPDKNFDRGVSELLAQFLVLFLVIILVALVLGMVTGLIPKMLQQSALLTVKASSFTTTPGAHVFALQNQQGNPVNINGSSQAEGIARVYFTVTTPSNTLVMVSNSSTIAKKSWKPGDLVYIYQVSGYYFVTDDLTWLNAQGAAVGVPVGSWSVNVLDANLDLLLQKLPVTIR